jgi:polyphosphate kinase 2 (PPK2 family)
MSTEAKIIDHWGKGGLVDAVLAALEAAGFAIVDFIDQTEAMLESYQRAREKLAAEGPPVLSPRVLLGEDGAERLRNSALSTEQKRTIPVQLVCRRG